MVILALASVALAGPWIRAPGDIYAKAGVGGFVGGEAASEAMTAAATYRDVQGSLYGEVGLPWKLQVTAYAPLIVAENRFDDLRYVSVYGGDAEVGLSRALYEGKVVLALGVGAKLPLYNDRIESRQASFGAHAARFPAAGDGQVDLDARLEAGASLGWAGAWTQGSVGYRHRFGPYVDGVPWAWQIGLAPQERGWVGIEASGIVNVASDTTTRSWTRLGAFGAVRLGPAMAIEAWAGAIPWATASRTGWGGGVGVSWNRPPGPSPAS